MYLSTALSNSSLPDYYDLLKKNRRIEDLSVRREMVKHLTLAFYYALNYRSHILPGEAQQSKQEDKALLQSTNMTILQISDELNFPSQSFFGKYFKRLTGMSPKSYREMKLNSNSQ
jgi:methylphosphotriester-DNA--protein-cysteine methyltransferase